MKNGSVRSWLRKVNVGSSDVLDVLQRAGVEVVDADHPVALGQQVIAQVRAEEPGSAGDDAGAHRRARIPAAGGVREPPGVGLGMGASAAEHGARRPAPGRRSRCSTRTGRVLRRIARRYSLCADDADDALQRAAEILLTKAPAVDPGRLIAWMARGHQARGARGAPRARAPARLPAPAARRRPPPTRSRRSPPRPRALPSAPSAASASRGRPRALADAEAERAARARAPGPGLLLRRDLRALRLDLHKVNRCLAEGRATAARPRGTRA